MDGAGWKAVMLTWWYAVMWFSLADLAKAGLQSIFRKHTEHALAYKEHGTPMPAWTKLIDIPNRLGSDLSTKLTNVSLFKVTHAADLSLKLCICFCYSQFGFETVPESRVYLSFRQKRDHSSKKVWKSYSNC